MGVRMRRVRRESGESGESEEGGEVVIGDRGGEGGREVICFRGGEGGRDKVEAMGAVDDGMNLVRTSVFLVMEHRSLQKNVIERKDDEFSKREKLGRLNGRIFRCFYCDRKFWGFTCYPWQMSLCRHWKVC